MLGARRVKTADLRAHARRSGAERRSTAWRQCAVHPGMALCGVLPNSAAPAPFVADLHIHSRYSMACSRDLTLPNLALWARRKGITLLGTGDFTHPAWNEHLREHLRPAEPGSTASARKPKARSTSACRRDCPVRTNARRPGSR